MLAFGLSALEFVVLCAWRVSLFFTQLFCISACVRLHLGPSKRKA